MITKLMKLTTTQDSDTWADCLLEGTEYGPAEIARVSAYLWDNYAGKTWGEVQPLLPTDSDWWDIVEGK